MKLRVDWKFLGTLTVALLAVALIVVVAFRVFGQTEANLVAVALAAFSVEIFRKFEKLSTDAHEAVTELSWPSFVSWRVLIGVLLIQSATLPSDLWMAPWEVAYGRTLGCSSVAFVGAVLLDWAGFLLCGFLVGRLAPARGLTVAAVGGFVFAVLHVTNVAVTPDALGQITEIMNTCFGWRPPAGASETIEYSMNAGGVIGLFARAGIAVYGARLGAQRPFQFLK